MGGTNLIKCRVFFFIFFEKNCRQSWLIVIVIFVEWNCTLLSVAKGMKCINFESDL